jgi:hypothetical protein
MTEATILLRSVTPNRDGYSMAGCTDFCACDEVCVCDYDTNPTECNCMCDLHTTCECNPHREPNPGEPGYSCRDK